MPLRKAVVIKHLSREFMQHQIIMYSLKRNPTYSKEIIMRNHSHNLMLLRKKISLNNLKS